MTLTTTDIEELKKVFVTCEAFDEFKLEVNSKFEEITVKLDKVLIILSEVMGELQNKRDEQEILTHKVYTDHEKRIEKLEIKAGLSN